ncbi:hypothetical protein DV735_g2540, partial [Chaetothyriales sp. CBS 134920]
MDRNEEPTARAVTAYGVAKASLAPSAYQQPNMEASASHSQLQEKGSQDTEPAQVKIGYKPQYSGASVATFFTGLFQTIIGIATLGASISFSYVLQQASTPTANFATEQVQSFLAVSWLLFLLDLAFASLGSTLLTFFKAPWQRDWDGLQGSARQFWVQVYAIAASAIMGTLIIGAFCLLCLVVVAYSPVVGWISLGFTGLFGVIIYVAIFNQVPWTTANPAQAIRAAGDLSTCNQAFV